MTNLNRETSDKLLVMAHCSLEELENSKSGFPVTYNLVKSFIHAHDEFIKESQKVKKKQKSLLRPASSARLDYTREDVENGRRKMPKGFT